MQPDPLVGAPAAPDVDADTDTGEGAAEPMSAPPRAKSAKGSMNTLEELLVDAKEEEEEEERPELPDNLDALIQSAK